MSLGNDLATLRKEKNLSLEDIFEVTKIPVHTLKSIENDTLLNSSSESKTYLRSFVRSYAKALKISDAHILAALKATEEGTYSDTLFKLVHPDSESESYSLKKDKVEVDSPRTIDPKELRADTYQEEIESTEKKKDTDSKGTYKPTVSTVNWADMSKKVYASPANSKIGLVLIIILVISGLGIVGYFYGGDVISLFSSDDGSEQTSEVDNQETANQDPFITTDDSTLVVANDGLEEDSPLTTPSSITLPETLTVVLYAAYDKLEPIRVTSDLNDRTNPFWMNQGEAYYFDFKDSLRVRGQYSRFLLMYNGTVINNPRQNHFDPAFNSIVITRDVLSAPEYQENNTNNFPANLGVQAPDSIIYRLEF
tara:strand:+ start:7021 stop:8118 length:1098 start_codon:yes stop_codon:yes gene_type:complete